MFEPIKLPFGAKMLFNTVKLKPGVKFEDVELAVGEMCNTVKETYGGDKGGFIAGQVFKFSGFVSDQGSLNATRSADEHYVIVTYWRSFEEHERSHADATFTNKFEALAKMCSETKELGYDMLNRGRRRTARARFSPVPPQRHRQDRDRVPRTGPPGRTPVSTTSLGTKPFPQQPLGVPGDAARRRRVGSEALCA
jgi:hypothetical protein